MPKTSAPPPPATEALDWTAIEIEEPVDADPAPTPEPDWDWGDWNRGTSATLTTEDGRTSLVEVTQADGGPEIRLAERKPDPPAKPRKLASAPTLPSGKVVTGKTGRALMEQARSAGLAMLAIDGGMGYLRATLLHTSPSDGRYIDTPLEAYGGAEPAAILSTGASGGGDLTRGAVRAWIEDLIAVRGVTLATIDEHALTLSARASDPDTVARAVARLAKQSGATVVIQDGGGS